MKKTILLIPLIFILQSCIGEFFKADNIFYEFELPAEKWVTITPKKDVYKVEDTIDITYKVPSKIGKYVKEESKADIQKYFNIKPENFIINNYYSGDYVTYKLDIALKSRYSEGHYPDKTIILINEGKEAKRENRELKGSVGKFRFNKETQEYIMKIKIIFLKPDTFYWVKGKEEDRESVLLGDEIQFPMPNNDDYYNSACSVKYIAPEDNIAIRVVE
ncbi:hypothetical protein KRX57_09840 [Weeksellaceae bacterium TAE3-ERU29]|nr:hypothetical protein [Weeksellaceae bacterium TAE3-ERU29]